ncbi:MAG: mechanosensitive ion channel [Flavobacteriales bacterium]|nr:mechanosensitive ion channel [Flavobacteriales bacterium]
MDTSWLDKGVHIHDYHLTIGDVIYIVLVFITIRLLLEGLHYLLRKANKSENPIEVGKRYTLVKLVSYFAYTIGVVMSLQAVGVDITVLVVGSAGLLVGIGLGLQHLFNDVVSGFVVLFEGTVRVGDIIEIDGTIARVQQIDIRTSKIVTREGIMILVPNSLITSNKVVNWSHSNITSRLSVNVGVAYGSDTGKVKQLLLQAAEEHKLVLKSPAPVVVFQDFGESSLDFQLRYWANKSWQMDQIKSDIRFRIDELFRENEVSIPFPQRDLHIISGETSLGKSDA